MPQDVIQGLTAEISPKADRALIEAVASAMPDALLVVDNAGLVRRVSDSFCRTLGLSFADMVGSPALDFLLGGSERREVQERLKHLFAHPGGDELSTQPLDARGLPRRFLWQIRPVDGMTSTELLMLGQDLSAQDRLEHRLREAQASLKALMAYQPVPVLELDRTGRILKANGATGTVLHRTPSALTGQHLSELTQGSGVEAVRDALTALDVLTPEATIEVPGSKDDRGLGESDDQVLAWRLRALFDSKGAIAGILAVGDDVSRLRKLERENGLLRQHPTGWRMAGFPREPQQTQAQSSEGSYRSEQPPSPVDSESESQSRWWASRQAQLLVHAEEIGQFGHWYWELKSDQVFWSPTAFRIRGLLPDQEPGSFEFALSSYHAEDRLRVRRVLQTARTSGRPFHFEARLVRVDGETRYVDNRGEVETGPDGKPVALFGVIQDVTEAKETERKLRAAKEEAETANRSKTDFMARLSHEFRTPLNNIIGFSESIVMEILGQIEPAGYRDYVQNILDSGKELVTSLDQLTDVKLLEDLLLREESSYRSLVELSPDLICICSEGRIRLINSAGAGILRAWSSEDLTGRKLDDFVEGASKHGLDIVLRSSGSGHRRIPIKFVTMTGQAVTLEVSATLFKTEDIDGVMLVGRDVTDRNTALETAIAREKRLQAVMDSVQDVILTMDTKGIIQDTNSAVERTFGYRPEQLIGKSITMLMPQSHATRHQDYVDHYMKTKKSRAMFRGRELTALHRDGSEFPVMITLSEIFDEGGHLFTGVIRNLSENKQLTEKVRYLANYDSMTDLPNRALMQDRITQAIAFANRAGREVAVLAFQVNEFSMVTGTLGHGAGDDMLRQTGQRLGSCIRPADSVGRTGSNEFMIVAANLANTMDVNYIVERVNQAMTKPLILGDQEIFVTCATGASIYPKDGNKAEDLMRNAITALNVARPLGAGAFGFFDTTMTAEVAERLTMERDLNHAIQRNEFELYYQPQMDLASGRVVGAEALIRWTHPRLGLVMPNRFIPVAEQTGQIIEIGRWVIRSAALQLKSWRDRGIGELRVGINLSARQFRDASLLDDMRNILAETELNPALLDLELTESLLMSDTDGAVETVRALKDLGVRISVDDFGTGYSSLAYLKQFKVDTLKIDQTFVREIDKSVDDEAIATAIISLGHSLGLSVIAEGVEHMGQVDALRTRGCDEIQGYLLSRPVSPEEFFRLLPDIRLPA